MIIMATNKERIEYLEAGLGEVQDGMHQMELGMADKFKQLEMTLSRISDALFSNKDSTGHSTHEREGSSRHTKDESDGGRLVVSSKTAKLEFPKFSGEDPTEWFARVEQFFEFQKIAEVQKVSLASFHLEGEANQWWRWLSRTFKEDGKEVTWAVFEEELGARFGPTEGEDFDEALSHIQQVGSLRDYQREFEKLGNRVHGWTQKAMVGTFMGGLKSEIAEGIRMFKPQTLKEAISLARMRDELLVRQRKFTRPQQNVCPQIATPALAKSSPASPIKRLSWDEMQRRRAQGLCFNCNDKFTAGHKCRGPQLLLLDAATGADSIIGEEVTEEQLVDQVPTDQIEPEVSLHGP